MGFSLPAVFTGDLHTGTNQDFLDGVKSVFANLAEKQQWEMKYGESISQRLYSIPQRDRFRLLYH